MSIKNKLVFTVQDNENKPVKLCVKKPNTAQSKELQKVYNSTFREALESGAIMRAKVESVARSQKVWDDEKQAEYKKLQTKISDAELKLAKGGAAGLSKKTAKELALQIQNHRMELRSLISSRNEIDANTAEAQAENMRFNHMLAMCTYYNEGEKEGKPYFDSYENLIERVSDKAAVEASKYMGFLIYNLEPNYELSLAENKFLIEYGFADAQGRLINKQGKLVDTEGRLVNEDGRYINEKNEFVDLNGNLVDEKGNPIVEFKPFLDDEE